MVQVPSNSGEEITNCSKTNTVKCLEEASDAATRITATKSNCADGGSNWNIRHETSDVGLKSAMAKNSSSSCIV